MPLFKTKLLEERAFYSKQSEIRNTFNVRNVKNEVSEPHVSILGFKI
jgi:hypothetical protein